MVSFISMMIFNKWGVNAAFMSLLAKVIISLIPAVRIILSVSFPPRTFPLQFRHICAVGEGLGGGGLAISRAIRGHLMILAALNTILLANAYNLPLPTYQRRKTAMILLCRG